MSRHIVVTERQLSNHFSVFLGGTLVLYDSLPGFGTVSFQGIWMAQKPNRPIG